MLNQLITLASANNAPQIGNYSTFFDNGILTMQVIVVGIGGFLLVQGIINLLQAYGDGSDARSKNQGWIQVAAGAGIIIIGVTLVPELANLFPNL